MTSVAKYRPVNSSVYRDKRPNTSYVSISLNLPQINHTTSPVQDQGSVAYDPNTQFVYYSNGIAWIQFSTGAPVTTGMIVVDFATGLANDYFVGVNSSAIPINLTLPAGYQGQEYFIVDMGQSFGSFGATTNNITLIPHGTDQFLYNNGSLLNGNYVINYDGAQVQLIYLPSSISGLGFNIWVVTTTNWTYQGGNVTVPGVITIIGGP